MVRFKGNDTSPELEMSPIELKELFEYLLISKFTKFEDQHFDPLLSQRLCNICGVK